MDQSSISTIYTLFPVFLGNFFLNSYILLLVLLLFFLCDFFNIFSIVVNNLFISYLLIPYLVNLSVLERILCLSIFYMIVFLPLYRSIMSYTDFIASFNLPDWMISLTSSGSLSNIVSVTSFIFYPVDNISIIFLILSHNPIPVVVLIVYPITGLSSIVEESAYQIVLFYSSIWSPEGGVYSGSSSFSSSCNNSAWLSFLLSSEISIYYPSYGICDPIFLLILLIISYPIYNDYLSSAS